MGEKKGKVCFIDKFPTHVNYSDWWGETVPATALQEDKGMVAHMSPEDAKKLYPPVEDYRGSVEKMRERIRKGQAINPPYLSFCLNIESCTMNPKTWVANHEGRHRIEAARLEDVKKMPVIFVEKQRELCETQIPREWKKLEDTI